MENQPAGMVLPGFPQRVWGWCGLLLGVVLLLHCGHGGSHASAASPLPTYSISGTVSGALQQGVQISLTGAATAATATDAAGRYSFAGLGNGSYTLTPSLAGYTFSPASATALVNGADVGGKGFMATALVAPTYSISGTVSGAVQQGVQVSLAGTAPATTTTDTSGKYSFAGLANGTYTLTPSLAGYTFSPVSAMALLNGADLTGKNFTAAVLVTPTYAISGTVSGAVQQGVQVSLSGAAAASTATDASGNYSFAGLGNGSYTLTPKAPSSSTSRAVHP